MPPNALKERDEGSFSLQQARELFKKAEQHLKDAAAPFGNRENTVIPEQYRKSIEFLDTFTTYIQDFVSRFVPTRYFSDDVQIDIDYQIGVINNQITDHLKPQLGKNGLINFSSLEEAFSKIYQQLFEEK